MNRLRLLLLAVTVLWLATAVVAYASWQDSTNRWLTARFGQIYLIYYGYPSFFQTSFFTVALVGFFVIVPVWVGHIYKHPKFSLRYKNLIVIFAGIVFIVLGACLLKWTWTLQQSVNSLNGLISKTTSPIAPVEEWRLLIDAWQPLILASALNGVIYVAISIVLFSLPRTRVRYPRGGGDRISIPISNPHLLAPANDCSLEPDRQNQT